MAEKPNPETSDAIDRLRVETMHVPIIGTTPLIVHAFAEKAKREMLEKNQKRKVVQEARNIDEEYEACFYRTKAGEYGFPVIAFKSCTIGAARFYDRQTVTMTGLRQHPIRKFSKRLMSL